MNFKFSILIIGIITFVLSTNCKAQSVDELRKRYMAGLHNIDSTPGVYDVFKKVENPSGKILGYTAALEAIMTKTTWNVFKKMTFLRKSEASFAKAVEKAPNDIEVRFMRMAVQFEIPEYLGFSEDIETDRKFIIANIDNFDTNGIPSETIDEILGFMVRCDKFTDSQIEKFRGLLAQK